MNDALYTRNVERKLCKSIFCFLEISSVGRNNWESNMKRRFGLEGVLDGLVCVFVSENTRAECECVCIRLCVCICLFVCVCVCGCVRV